MHALLFLFYSLLLGWLVTRMRFFRDSGVRPVFLLLFFGSHVLAGCFENWVSWHFFPGHGDVWTVFQLSFVTRHELLTDFSLFVAHNSTWVYLPHNILAIIHVVLNWLSADNLYINTLLFSFPLFLGSFALFRTFRLVFPGDPLTALSALFFPSALFWASSVYTEGVVYALTGWLLYILYASPGRGWNVRRVGCCVFIFLLAAFFRATSWVTLLPALVFWGFPVRRPKLRGLTARGDAGQKLPVEGPLPGRLTPRNRMSILVGIVILLLVLSAWLFPDWFGRLPRFLIARQHDFQQLEGSSRLYLPVLEKSWSSFFHTLPWALLNGFFEPLPGSGGKTLYLAFSAELLATWGVIVAYGFRRLSGRPGNPPVRVSSFCLYYAFSGILLVGLIVPFAGAIVRYRSIYLPFLLAPFLHAIRLSGPAKKINDKLNKYIFSRI
ncbi:MAG: hypothetical protein P4L51_18130 [Puia sp.]|nr:hypothetical protein [Puia sp.]